MAKKLTSTKAKKILHDKEVHGHPLTEQQRKFFGAIAGGAKPYKAQFGGIGGLLTGFHPNLKETASEVLSAPQKAATQLVTGKYQTPSEALGIQNAAGAFLTDVVLDPLGLLGIGAAKKMGALDNVYKINPLAKKTLSDPNKSYRVAGMDAYDDFVESGFLRSKTPMPQPGMSFAERMQQRPTAFPSFQKGFADLRYLPKEGGVVFETSIPTLKRGEINPVTGFPIKGRHYAHRVIDPETGKTLSRIPAKDIKVFEPKPHWLRGYKEVKPPKKKQDGGAIEGTMGGLTDKGFNFNPAWGGAWKNGGWLEKYADDIPSAQSGFTTQDSVRHQANKILQYEQLRGGPGGTPLPYYSDPKYMDMLINKVYPEVKKIMPGASAMEAAEAMDFIFNAGWDQAGNKITKDPRAYALQEYYRQYDPSKLDADGKWSGRKNPAYSFDQEYASTIGKLPENARRVLMNKGRDWYYKNINNPSPGVPNSNYYDTWYGRIWNTNDFQPFNPNNPKFIPKKQTGGILQPPMAGANQTVPMAQFGLTYLEPNSHKLPKVGPSSELAMSVGGENGEPAYLIPSMKYGRMQVDPMFEFKRTGEHLGGPFKTWQEADAWERDVRHPYVEKGESIPTPYRRWGQFEEGGSIPSAQRGTRQPIYTSDPRDPRLRAYQDSLNLYKAYQMQDKLMGPGSEPSKYNIEWTTNELKEGRVKRIRKGLEDLGPMSEDFQSEKDQFEGGFNDVSSRREDKKLIDYYKSLGFGPNQIMYHASPDIVSDKIRAIGTYFDGTANSPIYKKPVQPVVYKKPVDKNEPIYTSNLEDPRLKAYQDSLNLYKIGLSEINTYGGIGNDNQPKLNAKQKEENLRDVRNAIKNIIKPYSAESSITTTGAKTDGRNIFFQYIDEKTGKSFWRQSGYNANIAPDRYIKPKEHPDYFPYYKKPVQPVIYKKLELEKPGGVDLPEEIQFKDLPQPRGGYKSAAPAPQMISETPTKYSYTYPSGNQQKTIYFPSKSTWKAFVDQYDGLSTEERAGSFSASPGVYSQMRRPNPIFGNLKFAMGGSLPGSVGFTYARVAGAAPSEGPRAKKTLPSAQNGMEMKYYQEGLDFKPKTISKNGGWLDKYNDDVPQAQPGILQQRYSVGPTMGDLAVPSQAEVARQAQIRKEAAAREQQLAARARYEKMPKVGPAKQRSYSEQVQANEQRRRLNEAYAAQNPEVTVDESGDIVPSEYGRFIQTYGPNLDKFARSLETPLAIQGIGELAYGLGEIGARYLPQVGEYLTTQTPLKNAYKLNPWAFKPNPEAYYRGVGKEGIKDALETGLIRSKNMGMFRQPYFARPGEFKTALYYNPEALIEAKGVDVLNLKGKGPDIDLPKLNFAKADAGALPVTPKYTEGILGKPETKDWYFDWDVESIPVNHPDIKLLQKDWLRGYKEVPKSISEALLPPQQNNFGSIYTLNPITALGDLGDYRYYRKIGSGSGIKDLMESGAIRSGGGYDAPYFSPNTTWEGYRGTFAVGVNPKQVEGLEMINKNRGGLQRGFKSSLDEIPLSEGATGVFRRLPFSSAYTEIPVSSVLDPSKRTLREKILLNPTLANIQHGSEEALRYGIKGSIAQYIGNKLYGTEKDPTPLGTPLLLPAVSYLKKNLEKSSLNQPQQKEDGGEIVQDDEGYWNPQNWGKPVEINSNQITTEGVLEPLLGVSDTGDTQMMYPGKNYTFEGTKVVEYPREYFTATDTLNNEIPVAQKGVTQASSIRTSGPVKPAGRETIYVSNPNDPRLKSYEDSLYNYNTGMKMASILDNDKNLIKVSPKSPIYKNIQQFKNKFNDNTSYANTGYKNYDRIAGIMSEYQKKGNKGILPISIQPYWPDPDNTVIDLVTLRSFWDAIGVTSPRPGIANLPVWKKPEQQVVFDPSKAPKKTTPKPVTPVKKETPKAQTKKEQPPVQTTTPTTTTKAPIKSVTQTTGLPDMFRNPKAELLVDDFGNYEWFRTDDDSGDLKPIRRATREEIEYSKKQKQRNGGVSVNKADEHPLEKLDNLFNFTNYNKPTAKNGKWLDKYK